MDADHARLCEFDHFAKLNEAERRAVITTCTPEQQVALHMRWTNSVYPPTPDYEADIARTGQALIPALLARLEDNSQVHDGFDKIQILNVFYAMQREGYYDAADSPELMARLEQAIKNMQDILWKEYAFETLCKIRNKESLIKPGEVYHSTCEKESAKPEDTVPKSALIPGDADAHIPLAIP